MSRSRVSQAGADLAEKCFPGVDKARRRRFLIVVGVATLVVVVVVVVVTVAVVLALREDHPAGDGEPSFQNSLERAKYLMSRTPLIDGHNDLPYQYYRLVQNRVGEVDLRRSTREYGWHTDIPRLREGRLGAQFWSAYVKCGLQFADAVRATLEQIDVVHRFTAQYPDVFEFAWTAADVERIFAAGRIASMIGVEGGHSIDSSLATLRALYTLGVRYMTLTHSCPTPWADHWNLDITNSSIHGGLTEFGKEVVLEMNRVGMLVDLSHVTRRSMLDVLEVTRAPVIYSHSSVFSVCNHYRNVQDDVLYKLKENGGVVMINFYNDYVTCSRQANLSNVVEHFTYIKELIGSEYVGVGGDYDGVTRTPVGLEDVSKYPNLFSALLDRGWSDADVRNVLGDNLLRVYKRVEQVRDELSGEMPRDAYLNNTVIYEFSDEYVENGSADVCRLQGA